MLRVLVDEARPAQLLVQRSIHDGGGDIDQLLLTATATFLAALLRQQTVQRGAARLSRVQPWLC